jgi:hypothetical protein
MGTAGILSAGLPAAFGMLPAKAKAVSVQPDERRLKQLVDEAHARFVTVNDDKHADYIPYLASVPLRSFRIAIVTPNGEVIEGHVIPIVRSPLNRWRKYSRWRLS